MKKSALTITLAITVLALLLSGFSILKDQQVAANQDGTITLRMAQTSSETGAIGQSMEIFADQIYEKTNGRYKIET